MGRLSGGGGNNRTAADLAEHVIRSYKSKSMLVIKVHAEQVVILAVSVKLQEILNFLENITTVSFCSATYCSGFQLF